MNDSLAAQCTAMSLFQKLVDTVNKSAKSPDASGQDEHFEFLILGPNEKRWHEYGPSVEVSEKFIEFVMESAKNGLEFEGAVKLAGELVTNPSTKLYFRTGGGIKSGRRFDKAV